MDRRLKWTAFFGTECVSRPLERHYEAPGAQAPLPGIARRVRVGRGSETATDTQKLIPVRPVPFVDQFTARALPAGIARIDQHHGDTFHRCFITDQFSQLGKAPIRHPRPLVPLGLDPLPDAPEVFKGNQTAAAFGICDDGFAQDVVGVTLEARLPAGSAPERTLGRAGRHLLQGPAPGVLPATDFFDSGAGIGVTGAIDCEIDNTHVDPDGIIGADHGRFLNVTSGVKHPFPTNEHQIDLPLSVFQQRTLAAPTSKRNALAPFKRPDRNGVLIWQEAKDAVVVGLRGMAVETASRLFVACLQTIRDLGDAADGGLGGEAELTPHVRIG